MLSSALLALRDLLNSGAAGDWRCVYANFEVGQAGREDTARAMRAMLGELARRARRALGDETPNRVRHAALEQEGADGALIEVLARWAEADARPLVLLIDEIDTLVGDTLPSVLRQLRAGYDERPDGFPHSIVLCGVRDARLPCLLDRREPPGARRQRLQHQVRVVAARRLLRAGEDLPPRSGARGRRAGHGLGHVTLAMHIDELAIARSRFAAPAALACGGAAAQSLTVVSQGIRSAPGTVRVSGGVRPPPFALVRVPD